MTYIYFIAFTKANMSGFVCNNFCDVNNLTIKLFIKSSYSYASYINEIFFSVYSLYYLKRDLKREITRHLIEK